jgi:hypothetical protein
VSFLCNAMLSVSVVPKINVLVGYIEPVLIYGTISLYSGMGSVPHMPLPNASKTGCVQEQVLS